MLPGFDYMIIRKQFWERYFLERRDADDLQNLIQILRKVVPLLGDGDQQVSAQGAPDLDAHSVGRIAEEAVQAQVLLDPPKEQFDLPAAFVQQGDGQRGQVELVGDEDQTQPGLRIEKTDPAQRLGVVATTPAFGQVDQLIAAQTTGPVDRSGLDDPESDRTFEARDEVSALRRQTMEAGEVEESAIHHVVAATGYRDPIERHHLGVQGIVDRGKRRNVALQIEQHAELDRPDTALPPRPGAQGQTQLDHRRVQGEQIGLQSIFGRLLLIKPSGPAHQNRCDFGKDPPVAMFVRVRQIGPGNIAANTDMIKLIGSRLQARFDVPQSLPIGQLRKDHRGKVVVSRQRPRGSRHREVRRGTGQFLVIYTCEDLGKNGWAGIHFQARMPRKPGFQTKSRTPFPMRYSQANGIFRNYGESLTGQPWATPTAGAAHPYR